MNNWLAWVTALGGWVIGVVSDLGKEHWRRQRDVKEAHAKAIQKEILEPIHEYLKAFYVPICELRDTPITVSQETISKLPTNITEDAYAGTKFVLHPIFPERPVGQLHQVERWHETEGFKRYYCDARERHYMDLLQRWEDFRERFQDMQQVSLEYAEALEQQLRTQLGVDQLAPMGQPKIPWANYKKIAYILFRRHLGLDDEGIKFFDSWGTVAKTTKTQEEVFKYHSEPDAQGALAIIDGISKDVDALDKIRVSCKTLAIIAEQLSQEFRFEISKNPKLVKCDFV